MSCSPLGKLDRQRSNLPPLDIDSIFAQPYNYSSASPPLLQSLATVTIIPVAQIESKQFQLQIDQFGDFEVTKRDIRAAIGIAENIEIELKLASGGYVERNAALMENDIVYAYIKNQPAPAQIVQKQVLKKWPISSGPKIGAYDTNQTYTYERNYCQHHNGPKFFLKEMDFKHLECMILTSQVRDSQDLVQTVNGEWALQLGFTMKIKRSPKCNRDGSKTLRLYCNHHNSHYTQDDINMIEQISGLKEETCFFGLTFRFIPGSNVWILYDNFEAGKIFHSHPFYYESQKLLAVETAPDPKEIEIVKVVSNSGQIEQTENPVQKYYRIYKAIIGQMSSMDHILKQKANGIIIPPRRCTSNINEG
ncbi:hypothetical protein FGO68_gene15044 [Halteria grandinella]|uniref:Uncharacterized protein n=1 Tax=Halteria grandinella TaxID=5974 RepID=A0A8J8P4G6_HALGN|nr:hypothetical protein FGO68_gene15044 [Halteria grandinella]